jgi:hypothetical protein
LHRTNPQRDTISEENISLSFLAIAVAGELGIALGV